jgi:hypothetical protein
MIEGEVSRLARRVMIGGCSGIRAFLVRTCFSFTLLWHSYKNGRPQEFKRRVVRSRYRPVHSDMRLQSQIASLLTLHLSLLRFAGKFNLNKADRC